MLSESDVVLFAESFPPVQCNGATFFWCNLLQIKSKTFVSFYSLILLSSLTDYMMEGQETTSKSSRFPNILRAHMPMTVTYLVL